MEKFNLVHNSFLGRLVGGSPEEEGRVHEAMDGEEEGMFGEYPV